METEIKFNVTATVTSKAKIENNFVEIGSLIDNKIAELNFGGQLVSAETKQGVKKMKSEWNKMLEPVEAAFKAAISEAETPIKEIKALFKEHVTDKKAAGYNILSDKVKQYEDMEKAEKETVLRDYFDRCQEKYAFEFLAFEHCIRLPLLLSTSEKAYKEQILQKFQQTESDIAMIETQQYVFEILAEYKKTLNCNESIIAVNRRKEAEKAEIEKAYTAPETQTPKETLPEEETPEHRTWTIEINLFSTRYAAGQFISEFRELRKKYGATITNL
ncbi:MAG: DUF1351 domain-containing protein [Dysgonamonadaceae bacterium]|jgi:hypothetical protein|nr:DUF1351 domain-containing protein [Dysgonamonadaceae bacterium]